MGALQVNEKIQLLNVKHRIKIVSLKKFSKVSDARFRANVLYIYGSLFYADGPV